LRDGSVLSIKNQSLEQKKKKKKKKKKEKKKMPIEVPSGTFASLSAALLALRSLPSGALARRKREAFKETFAEAFARQVLDAQGSVPAPPTARAAVEAGAVAAKVDPAGCAALCAGKAVREKG
jgi:hypothetical protein